MSISSGAAVLSEAAHTDRAAFAFPGPLLRCGCAAARLQSLVQSNESFGQQPAARLRYFSYLGVPGAFAAPAHVAAKIADMSERRDKLGLEKMQFGVSGYVYARKSEREVAKELQRITDVKQNVKGYANYQQWLQGTQLEQSMSIQEYSVSNRGLRSGLVGTPSQVQEQIGKFEDVGVDILLLQFSPQLEEMEIFSDSVMHRG